MFNYRNFILLTIATLFSLESFAQLTPPPPKPGLLVTPTRVILEGRNRSASVSIANNGNKVGSYRISLVNRRMSEDGSISVAEDVTEDDMFADQILRISPRRVTIEPGGHQSVRILARKPKDLPDGEYRSHLRFMVLPDETVSERERENSPEEGLQIAIKANFGITIPVIIRHGNLDVSSDISDISLSKIEDVDYLNFNISRNGEKSLYGDIEIKHIDNKGEETIIKTMGGLAVYTPNKVRQFKIPVETKANLKKGTIIVTYREKEKDGGKVIASGQVTY